MDMIDQYLEAVAAQLPAEERDDIIAELRDLILSRFEAREEELQRALNDNERLAILRQIGHPLVVATRYRKGPDTLIGPELFPYWLFAVKAGLLIQAALFALSLVLGLLSDAQHVTRDLMQAVHGYVWAAVTLFGATTLVGAVLEHNKIKPRWMTQWRINDLKALSLPSAWILPPSVWKPARSAAASVLRRPLPGKTHVLSLVAHGIFLAWWIGLVQFEALTHLRRRGEDVLVTAAPIWTALHEVILIYVLAHMAADLWSLIQPQAIRAQAALEAALACAGLWVLWTVFNAGHWFTLSTGTQSVRVEAVPLFQGRGTLDGIDSWFARLGAGLSLTLTWVMAIVGFVTLVRIVRALVRMGRG